MLGWAARRRHIFEEPSDDTIPEVIKIMSQFRNFSAAGSASSNAADPWLIAHAKIRNATVVTYEQHAAKQNPKRPPKIRNVCVELGVPCVDVVEFMASNGLSF